MTHSKRNIYAPAALFLAAMFVFLTLTPAIARAEEPEDVWAAVFVYLYDLEDGMEPTLVITGAVRPGLEPPVDAALAIPKGAQISWIGSIMGGDPADDPTLDFTIEERDEYDLVHMQLVDSPRINIELLPPANTVVNGDGFRQIEMSWTSAGAIDQVKMAIAAPLDTHLEDMVPRLDVEIDAGATVYSVETSPVAAAQSITVNAVLKTGADPLVDEQMAKAEDAHAAVGEETGTPTDTPAPKLINEPEPEPEGGGPDWLLIVGLSLGLAVVVALLLRRRAVERSSDGGDAAAGQDSPQDDGSPGEESPPEGIGDED